jgi:hypothetical protein
MGLLYNNGWNVTPLQQKYLFLTSNLSALTAYYAYKNKLSPHLYLPIGAIWVTSIIYWINPLQHGWQKTLDICTSHLAITYYCGALCITAPPYWWVSVCGIMGSAVLFRWKSLEYYQKILDEHDSTCPNEQAGIYHSEHKNWLSWKCALYHSGIHIFTNMVAGLSIYSYTL